MTYTIQQLAKLAKVSVRTLHWYDKIGLLKPSYCGQNNYRYYEEKELLLLQQILFFKELGFALKDIQKILFQKNFDTLKALQTHRTALKDRIARNQTLLQTIDQTIDHLKGDYVMQNQGFYKGFEASKQKDYERYIIKSYGSPAEKLIEESKKRTAKWDENEWKALKTEGDALHRALAEALHTGIAPENPAVQKLIAKHYAMQNRFFDVSKEVYLSFAELYEQHPDFQKFFKAYHEDLIPFLQKAMRFYAEKNL